MKYHYIKLIIILIVTVALFSPVQVLAAKLFISPDSGTATQGNNFTVFIKVDTENADINVIEAMVHFPQDILEVQEISKSDSIFGMWAQEPSYSNRDGFIEFVGGIPSGFNGSSGTVLAVMFKAKEAEQAVVNFGPSRVFLSDGKGTNVFSEAVGASYTTQKVAVSPATPLEPVIEESVTPFEEVFPKGPVVQEGEALIITATPEEIPPDQPASPELQRGEGEDEAGEPSLFDIELEPTARELQKKETMLSVIGIAVISIILVVAIASIVYRRKLYRKFLSNKGY